MTKPHRIFPQWKKDKKGARMPGSFPERKRVSHPLLHRHVFTVSLVCDTCHVSQQALAEQALGAPETGS